MSYQLAEKRVRPKVFYYAYAPSTPSHTRCSRTGSDRQLKHSCRLGHSPFREAKTPKRVEEFFGFSKFWISSDKRSSCVISNAVFGALFKLLAPSKNLHRGYGSPASLPAHHCLSINMSWLQRTTRERTLLSSFGKNSLDGPGYFFRYLFCLCLRIPLVEDRLIDSCILFP